MTLALGSHRAPGRPGPAIASGFITPSGRPRGQSVGGGTPVVVRTDNARAPALASDGSALYYIVPLQNSNGSQDYELRVARPENAPSTLLAHIPGDRVPIWQGLHPVISKDGKWLVMPLDDRLGTNIWVASTADGKLRQITDFGEKRTFIARRISWSSDGKWVWRRRCRYRADGRASELEQPYRIRIPREL